MFSAALLLPVFLVPTPDPPDASAAVEAAPTKSDEWSHQRPLTTAEAIAAEPGMDLVALPGVGLVVVKDGPVKDPSALAAVGHGTDVYLNEGVSSALALPAESWAAPAVYNAKRTEGASELFEEFAGGGGPFEMKVRRWSLVVLDAGPTGAGEWRVRIFPSAELTFGRGGAVEQTGQYLALMDEEAGTGPEIWTYREPPPAGDGAAADAPAGGGEPTAARKGTWTLVRPAAPGYLTGR